MIWKLIVTFVFFLFPSMLRADTLILGWDPGEHCNSDGNFNNWKGIQFRAERSGDADTFGLYVLNYTGSRYSDTLGYAIYRDINGAPGELMCYGCAVDYNWAEKGTGVIHTFPIQQVRTTRYLTAGSYYWIFYGDDIGTEDNDSLWTGRCNQNMPDLQFPKRGSSGWTQYCTPPPVGEIDIDYGTGNYEFSVWDADTVNTTTTIGSSSSTTVPDTDSDPPSPPTGLRIIPD